MGFFAEQTIEKPVNLDSIATIFLGFFCVGKLEEYDKPSRLMENQSSAFSKLVQEYWSNCKRSSAIEESII